MGLAATNTNTAPHLEEVKPATTSTTVLAEVVLLTE